MNSQPINAVDVARAAGVTVSSVSRALSGSKGVSEQTRLRIRRIAEDLGYVVSPEASRLARGRTGRVGLVAPFVNEWFYSQIIAGIASELTPAGIDVLLYALETSQERQRFFRELPARRKVDAIVVVAFPITESEWRRLNEMNVEVVVAGYVVPGLPSVGIDDQLAAAQAVNHLLALGHRSIAMITTEDPEGTHFAADLDRQRGYRAALRDAGVALDESLVVSTKWGIRGGALAMDLLLSRAQLPTAVFAFSDEVAFGAMQSLRRAGLRVPEDISIVSVDDHPMAESMDLTTVRQSVREQGSAAGRMCRELIAGMGQPQPALTSTRLVVRRSTCPPAVSSSPRP